MFHNGSSTPHVDQSFPATVEVFLTLGAGLQANLDLGEVRECIERKSHCKPPEFVVRSLLPLDRTGDRRFGAKRLSEFG